MIWDDSPFHGLTTRAQLALIARLIGIFLLGWLGLSAAILLFS